MQKIYWNNLFKIGIEDIDDDHKKILAYINKLDDALNSEESVETIMAIFEKLILLSTSHFEHEDDLMQKYNYSEKEVHQKEHLKFINTISHYKSAILKKSSKDQLKKLHQEAAQWFIQHIINEDMKFKKLINQEKNIFKNFKLEYRLGVMVLLPSLIALLFTFFTIQNYNEKQNNAAKLYRSSELLINMNALISNLQKERGLSMAYIHSQNSMFLPNLMQQRIKVNNTFLHCDPSKFDNLIFEKLSIHDDYQKIIACRHNIDLNQSNTKNIFKIYTKFIDTLLQNTQSMSLHINNNEMRLEAIAINALFNELEIMGLQRAFGSMILQGEYSDEQASYFIELNAKKKIYEAKFLQFSSEDLKVLYHEDFRSKVPNLRCSNAVTSIVTSIFTQKKYYHDSKVYFEGMSENIKNLNILLNHALEVFKHNADSKKHELQNRLYMFSLLFVLLFIAAYFLFRKVQKSIYQPIHNFSKALQVLTTNREDFYAYNQVSHNLGFLNDAYQSLRTQFLKADTQAIFQEQKNSLLEDMANIDVLTEIFNRRKFDEILHYEFTRSLRSQHIFSILMLDIDHFKVVNDTYGHDVGDVVLKELVSVLRPIVRDSDTFARLGGEEFVILLPETLLEDAIAYAERIRKNVEEHNIKTEHKDISITLSIGVARFSSDEEDPYATLKNADKALYKAKNGGRNRVCSYQDFTVS